MPTRVCISVDTEFSIGGAFTSPMYRPIAEQRVWCDVGGKSEGLGFMLDCFSQYRISATFFVEALHRHYFSQDPMRPIVKRLQADGHELGLHLHPCWEMFQYEDWQNRARQTRGVDAFFGRSEADSVRLIEYGLSVFRDWDVPSPLVFRSASLQHDDTLYRALARTGIRFSSNVGLAIFDSGDPRYRLYGGRHERHSVLECPILTFSDWQLPGKQHLKSLTVTGTSFEETRDLLDQAHEMGIEQVVILTHPFEFVQTRDFTLRRLRRHRLNQRRLTQLCQYLDANRARFLPCGIAAAASVPMDSGSAANPLLKGATWRALPRMAGQFAYDRYSKWRLDRQPGREAQPPATGDSEALIQAPGE